MHNPVISIIVVSYDNWSFTETCLKSIIQNTRYPQYEIIVVDNASKPPTKKPLKKVADNFDMINVIYNKKTLGCQKLITLVQSMQRAAILFS